MPPPLVLYQSLVTRLCSLLQTLLYHVLSLYMVHIRRCPKCDSPTDLSATPAKAVPTSPDLPTPAQLAQLIKSRRSIYPKHMTGDRVSTPHINAMLEAANWAPTHGHTEPWRFVVLGRQAMQDMQTLTEEIFRVRMSQYPEALQNVLAGLQHDRLHRWRPVSHMIAICMSRQPNPDKLMPLWEELAAVACAVQNMHLTAAALGLGTYWSSWHEVARDSPEMLEFLGLDHSKGDRCWGFMVLGTVDPQVAKSYRASRGPIEHKVVFRD